jgi:hypothetical protein
LLHRVRIATRHIRYLAHIESQIAIVAHELPVNRERARCLLFRHQAGVLQLANNLHRREFVAPQQLRTCQRLRLPTLRIARDGRKQTTRNQRVRFQVADDIIHCRLGQSTCLTLRQARKAIALSILCNSSNCCSNS